VKVLRQLFSSLGLKLLSDILLHLTLLTLISVLISPIAAQEFYGCGGFIKSEGKIDFGKVKIKLLTKEGALKDSTDCAPNNGYYLIPVYDKGEYVIKVESEAGWNFSPAEQSVHVDGSTDACSNGQDLNFQFVGLTIGGAVLSAGDVTGPEGIVVHLKRAGETVATTSSDVTGRYSFTSVLPGDDYVIEATREDFVFHRSSFPLVISAEDKEIKETITIAGYDVSGRVVSEGEPIKGVQFILYATPGASPPADCVTDSLPASSVDHEVTAGLTQLCYVISGDDGAFQLRLLANGRYAVVPHYVGENIRFDVLPPAKGFEVNHGHNNIEEVFRVEGFTVQGSVRITASGAPLVGAKVAIDGVLAASTDENGIYKLENIKTGTYKIDVEAVEGSGYHFPPSSMKITPNTPLLPEILPSQFDVCGRISLVQIPPALVAKFASSERRVEVTQGDQVVTTIGVKLDAEGADFCTRLPPGDYQIAVVTTEEEAGHGFILTPKSTAVAVTHSPVKDVVFSQAMGSIKGVVECLESCLSSSEEDPMRVIVTSVARSERVISLQVTVTDDPKRSLFQASNILPGRYNVSIVKKSLCWQVESVIVEASVDGVQDTSDIVFSQSGFRLSCDISHDTELNFEMEKEEKTEAPEEDPSAPAKEEEENVGSFQLVKGLNRFCLSHPGVYNLMPRSDCHQFAQSVYQFKTSSSFPTLRISAVKHALNAEIHADVETPDLTATVTSLLDDTEVTLGPLPRVSHSAGHHVYRLRHWGRHGESFKIAPAAAKLLFHPESVTTTLKSENGCEGPVAVVKGTEGIFISGHVTPAIPNVRIIITPEKTPDLRLLVETDDSGRYRVGPQDGSTKYSVVAEKENYVMTPLADDPYSFNAFKLGEIRVQVVDGEDENAVLGGVLLSLSGGKGYRSNNMTNGDGSLAFTHLSPGQYFLRPMKKEYQFDPPNQMIDVIEGTTVNLKIAGNRVAFSIYGNVNSLNGDGENGIAVEAFGPGDVEGCSVSQEEAKTDAGGAFRIRGLTPGCNYKIRVKSAETCPGNGLLERTTPVEINVAMETRDLHNLTFIALRKIKEMDVSGHVTTSIDHVTSLKAKLCLEDNEDSPVHTIPLGQVPFFFFPAIPIDERKYVVIIESNLPRHRFDYPESMKASFSADRPFKHLRFDFQPTVKSVDAELGLQGGGLFTFPVILLLLLAAYYHETLLVLASSLLAHGSEATRHIFAAATSVRGAGAADDAPLRRKKKAFKEQ